MIVEEVAHSVASGDIFNQTTYMALAIFAAAYGLILSDKINRAIVAVLGGGLMVLAGIITQEQAVGAIDFNTLGLLLGMMIIVAIMKESGVFQYIAIKASKFVKASPIGILIVFSLITAIFSALLDNVTTVLLTTPVLLLITRELEIKPYPFLFTNIFAANIGGSSTLIGDPLNVMIGSAAGLSFNDFATNLAPLSAVIMISVLIPILLFYRKSLKATPEAKKRILELNEKEAITDIPLLIKSLTIIVLVLIGFTLGHSTFHIPPATMAMTGAALLLFLDNCKHCGHTQHEKVHTSIAEAEWITLFFFGGLFVLVHSLEHLGIMQYLADSIMNYTEGDRTTTIFAILWTAAVVSAFLDNIPFVATMIPMLNSMAPAMGGAEAMEPLWWALALGACLGGNGSLIGASSNLVVSGFAGKAGHGINPFKYMLGAIPLVLISIAIATAYIWFRYI